MENFQNWIAPLLWVLATITAIVSFIRLCKPVWKIFSSPKDFSDRIDSFNVKLEKLNTRLTIIDDRLDGQDAKFEELRLQRSKENEISLSLLHDSIVQICQQAKRDNCISEVDYYRAHELYKQDGESPYIDNLMKILDEMYNRETMDGQEIGQ